MSILKSAKTAITILSRNNYVIINGDSSKIINEIEDNSIKLFYGSPPYPNAKRNYGIWKTENYIKVIDPFIRNAIPKLKDDGFIVLNIKANRTNPKKKNYSSERSLIVEELMLHVKKKLKLFCVDVEIWIKSNPIPTGVRVACQDAYEYNIWFSKSSKWEINIDEIRRKYSDATKKAYESAIYKPRQNGLKYVSKEKMISENKNGALPVNIETKNLDSLVKNSIINYSNNIVHGSVSNKIQMHQAVQPEYLPEKYILACTKINDIVYDPWLGSGTTGLVALKNGRKFIGVDISEQFCAIALKNLEERGKKIVKKSKT
jgi:DNA modification methylase